MLGKWETPSICCVTLCGWRFVEPLGVGFGRTVQSPGITDGGRVLQGNSLGLKTIPWVAKLKKK